MQSVKWVRAAVGVVSMLAMTACTAEGQPDDAPDVDLEAEGLDVMEYESNEGFRIYAYDPVLSGGAVQPSSLRWGLMNNNDASQPKRLAGGCTLIQDKANKISCSTHDECVGRNPLAGMSSTPGVRYPVGAYCVKPADAGSKSCFWAVNPQLTCERAVEKTVSYGSTVNGLPAANSPLTYLDPSVGSRTWAYASIGVMGPKAALGCNFSISIRRPYDGLAGYSENTYGAITQPAGMCVCADRRPSHTGNSYRDRTGLASRECKVAVSNAKDGVGAPPGYVAPTPPEEPYVPTCPNCAVP